MNTRRETERVINKHVQVGLLLICIEFLVIAHDELSVETSRAFNLLDATEVEVIRIHL